MSSPSHRPHHAQQQQQYQQQQIQAVTYDVVGALRNPYAQLSQSQFHSPYSMHFLQSQQTLYTTPEGYTLSSTYNPNARTYNYAPKPHRQTSSFKSRGFTHGSSTNPSRSSAQPSGSWYQTGSSGCSYPGCRFTGSLKSVELHMMDRHLIYPPGWHKKQKKGPDWDADPSLKGKTIPIQGTSLVLNTPEALDAWLAERKKRWPTVERVKEKGIKMEKAIAQGQLPFTFTGTRRGTKRSREGMGKDFREKKGRFDGNEAPRAKAPRTSRMVDQKVQSQQTTIATAPRLGSTEEKSLSVVIGRVVNYPDSESNSDDHEGPEIVSSKQLINSAVPPAVAPANAGRTQLDAQTPRSPRSGNRFPDRPKKKEPRLLPQNPFASRPTLLRNLLFPEIRMTVSNLSQAIRFLVDNDFLRGVELEPGQADHNLIEVIDSQPAEPITPLVF